MFFLAAAAVVLVSVKAKFHYAIWFEAGRGPVADLLARASSLLAS